MNQTAISYSSRSRQAAAALLVVHAALLAWSAQRHSPVVVEPAHLAAGLAHIEKGQFDLYRVNPPLVRMVAAAPVALAGVQTDWVRDDPNPLRRCEFDVGQDLLRANSHGSPWLFTLGRWACIPFSLLGGYIVYRWATELFGAASGLFALTLWCFSPSILGHAALFTPDAPAASMAIASSYIFFRWVKSPTWHSALLAGGLLGLTELTKTTLLLLYPTLLLVWIFHRPPLALLDRLKHEAPMLAAIVGASLLVLNMGYGFEGSGQRVDAFHFESQLFAGPADQHSDVIANRLARLGFGSLPVPLPANYIQGIDAQRLDFERTKRSYLNGRWRSGGWPHFYLAALAVKTPLGTLALVAMATVLLLSAREFRADLSSELALLLPALTVFSVVSSQTGFSIHPRYVLPALPFLFIWTSRVTRAFPLRRPRVAAATCMALVASVASSLWCFPHELSYINEAAGGPQRGHRYLLDSGVAWGQDLIFLRDWLDEHPEASPCYLAAFGYLNPAQLGIDYRLPPVVVAEAEHRSVDAADSSPPPGWYVIDVNHLMGTDEATPDPEGTRCLLVSSGRHVQAFRDLTPIARAGYSLLIYKVPGDTPRRTPSVVVYSNGLR